MLQYRHEPPPEFSLTLPISSFVHHLLGPDNYALSQATLKITECTHTQTQTQCVCACCCVANFFSRYSSGIGSKLLMSASKRRRRQRAARGSESGLRADSVPKARSRLAGGILDKVFQRRRAARGSESAKERQRSLGSHESGWSFITEV